MMCHMSLNFFRKISLPQRRQGFTLIELLVVLVIVTIILSIAVPAILSGRSQRVLVASASRFYADLQWAMTEAQKSGTNYYLGFKCDVDRDGIMEFDQGEILGHEVGPAPRVFRRDDQSWVTIYGKDGNPVGETFYPPDNPGYKRIATGFYIIKESPRFWSIPNSVIGSAQLTDIPREGTPYTYIDFLNELDKYNADPNNYPAPLEPQYPIDVNRTLARGGNVTGPFINRTSVPKFFYPIGMTTGGTYVASFLGYDFVSGNLDFSDIRYQANKLFCVADTEEILLWDRVDSNSADGVRTYDTGDHPRLKDQIYDYVLVKEVDLPDGIYFLNPWKNLYQVGTGRSSYMDFQFLQYIYRIAPDGSFRVYHWTYNPESFPDNPGGPGSLLSERFNAGLVHGMPELRLSTPDFVFFFLTVEEVIDPEQNFNVKDTRRAQMDDFGRVVTVWTLNSRVTIDPYAPNDAERPITPAEAPVGSGWFVGFNYLKKRAGLTYDNYPY